MKYLKLYEEYIFNDDMISAIESLSQDLCDELNLNLRIYVNSHDIDEVMTGFIVSINIYIDLNFCNSQKLRELPEYKNYISNLSKKYKVIDSVELNELQYSNKIVLYIDEIR